MKQTAMTMMNNTYIQFSACDADGQFQNPFSIEIMRMSWQNDR